MAHNNYTTPEGQAVRNASVLAMAAPRVITDEYRRLNQQLHQDNPYYGVTGHLRADAVIGIAQQLNTQDVLDYGCGKGTLAQNMPWPIHEYDPAIPGKDRDPNPADIVVCTDVLEHIEPELLDHVLMDLGRCTKKIAYLVIYTSASLKTLPDGRNTHLIQENRDWWYQRLEKWFIIDDCYESGYELHFIVRRRGELNQNLVDIDRLNQTTTFVETEGIKFVNANGMMDWRARTLLTKEPITIEWLNTFQEGDVFVDIGANVGTYSLYAAKKRFCRVYAFEPESQNYAALNYNINLNRSDALVKAYCLAISNKITLGALNLSQMIAGNSCHQFNRSLDHRNQPARFSFAQGCMSVTLDWLLENGLIDQPTHIKIDVDGIECLVVQGMSRVLENTQSLLIEINQNLQEHQDMVQYLLTRGFTYDPDQVKQAERKQGAFKGVAEFLFRRGH
jgi:FkbM family methyltransferase